MAWLARFAFYSPRAMRWLLCKLGWHPVEVAWIDAPFEYRFVRWFDSDAHGGAWRHHWRTLPGRHR